MFPLSGQAVTGAVQLHGELRKWAVEIQEVGRDLVLAAELEAGEATAAEGFPQGFLFRCLLAAEAEGKPLNLTLLITHSHWDHIQGFPFFVPAYDPESRLRILGYEGASEGLRTTLAGQMESPYFPLALDQLPGNIEIEELKDMHFQIGAIPVDACFTNHPGVCVGYRFQTSGGVIVYMPDNETVARNAKHGPGLVPSTIEGDIVDFVRDADVLVLDAQYDAKEYAAHVGWGHGCVDEVVALAVRANVKRLYLFHHDPAHDDRVIGSMVAHARALAKAAKSTIRIEAAREGEVIALPARAAARVS